MTTCLQSTNCTVVSHSRDFHACHLYSTHKNNMVDLTNSDVYEMKSNGSMDQLSNQIIVPTTESLNLEKWKLN